uniref:Uncharacterized protein n=1 Tax=Siphoviridae sp. ctcRb7 TaxID=2825572 RepID=A0A8S5U2Z7_9CAUD|nr:MAG TPA: hypothetical protein [Siphoviridae sp. ctcRb7]DAN74159.1 MAG TPA: hypothetical protein [Caudoviricetes sp.]
MARLSNSSSCQGRSPRHRLVMAPCDMPSLCPSRT